MAHSPDTARRCTYAAIFSQASLLARPPVFHSGVSPTQIVRADTALFAEKLDSIADAHHGVVGYSVIDLEDGRAVLNQALGDETFPTASLIKVGILVTVYELVAKGHARARRSTQGAQDRSGAGSDLQFCTTGRC